MITTLKQLWKGGNAPSTALDTPFTGRIYAIGDIHGRADLLQTLFGQICADIKANPTQAIQVVTLGDYINRGPASAQVIAFLRHQALAQLQACTSAPITLTHLAGNHERESLAFLQNPATRPDWLGWGGITTLESYGIKPHGAQGPRNPEALAAELEHALTENGDLAWLQALPVQHVVGPYAFVHAGVRPGLPLHAQMEADLTFIREDWWNRPHGLPYTVVFGHTPVHEPLVTEDRIGIDTGAYRTGVLTAVVLEANQAPRFLQTHSTQKAAA